MAKVVAIRDSRIATVASHSNSLHECATRLLRSGRSARVPRSQSDGYREIDVHTHGCLFVSPPPRREIVTEFSCQYMLVHAFSPRRAANSSNRGKEFSG